MARCMSSLDASATSPIASSVAGLMLVKVPAWPATSLPSIIIFDSKRTFTASVMVIALCGWGAAQRAGTRDAHRQTGHPMESLTGKQPVGNHQQAGVDAAGSPRERARVAQRGGGTQGKPIRRPPQQRHPGAPPPVDLV